jgi:hypothetical protein
VTGHRSFNELRKTMSPVRRARNKRETRVLLEGLALFELRQSREQSQDAVASRLQVGQPAVAKMERRGDMYVSNLRRYVEALGGTLEINARFPDSVIPISLPSDDR